jgi:hypothetical protein
MEAYGADGIAKLDDRHLTIYWTSLRGRLSATSGADVEVLPLVSIFDHIFIPAGSTTKGCLQIRQIDTLQTKKPINRFENWMQSLIDEKISHCLLFKPEQQFSFSIFEKALRTRLDEIRIDRLSLLVNEQPEHISKKGLA